MGFGLEPFIPYVLYAAAIVAFVLSITWKPVAGIFYLLPLIPLQTIRYRTNELPLGSSIVGIILVGVAIGIWRKNGSVLPKSPWTKLVLLYALFTYISLWLGASYIGHPWPLFGDTRFGEWQEQMVMPVLLLLTAAAAPNRREIQWMVLVICLGTLALDKSFWNAVADRDFSTYSDALREDGGSMGYAGTNGLAAFTAQAIAFLLALAAFERKFWIRIGYYALAVYSAICLMYSLSRGGYVALAAGLLFLAFLKQRKLLVVLVVFLATWTAIVPNAVRERVDMTYDETSGQLDNSAETRLALWSNAMEKFSESPILGAGFNTYAYMHLNKRTDGREGYYADTHNYFVKILIETGVVGFVVFLILIGRLFFDGFRTFLRAKDPLYASLGLGLAGWLLASLVANLFGDRWTFLQVNGYMWVIAGLVCRGWQLEQENELALATTVPEEAEAETEAPTLLPDYNLPSELPSDEFIYEPMRESTGDRFE